jgi:hypothetical protein
MRLPWMLASSTTASWWAWLGCLAAEAVVHGVAIDAPAQRAGDEEVLWLVVPELVWITAGQHASELVRGLQSVSLCL